MLRSLVLTRENGVIIADARGLTMPRDVLAKRFEIHIMDWRD